MTTATMTVDRDWAATATPEELAQEQRWTELYNAIQAAIANGASNDRLEQALRVLQGR